MGKAEDLHTAGIHLERLRRHHQTAFVSGDPIALLDLSNTLRIWVQMKQSLAKSAPALLSSIAFKTGSPPKQLTRQAAGREHVLCYMGGEVRTMAANGMIARGPEVPGDFQVTCGVRRGPPIEVTYFRRFCLIRGSLGPAGMKHVDGEDIRRVNFVNWLGSEVARLAFREEDGRIAAYSLTREMVVNRVANILDGSHSSVEIEANNRFDPAIKHLQLYTVGGLQLQYFILLKIAQDMLEHMARLLGLNPVDLIVKHSRIDDTPYRPKRPGY